MPLRRALPSLTALCLAAAFGAPARAASSADEAACRALTRPQLEAELARYRQQVALRAERETLEERQKAPLSTPPRTTTSLPSAAPQASMAAPPVAEAEASLDRSAALGDVASGSASPAPRPSRARAPAAAAKAGLDRAGGSGAKKDQAGPRTYSRTNTQELAVDEGDIVKTNGRRIYHVSCRGRGPGAGCRDEIRVYASWPPQRAGLVSRYRIPQRGGAGAAPSIRQLYLSGDDVVAILEGHEAGLATSRVVVIDMSAPSAPVIVREALLDGRFVESRMIGQDLYLATTTPPVALPGGLLTPLWRTCASWPDEAWAKGGPSADEVVDALPATWRNFLDTDPGLPKLRTAAGSPRLGAAEPLYTCADLETSDAPNGGPLLNLARVDTTFARAARGVGVSGYGPEGKVYASEGAFYVAHLTDQREPGWGQATELRKFRLGAQGPRFAAAGRVRGQLLNQFSMSEFEGHLRVATSDGWSNNGLYVLAEDRGALTPIGRLEGFGNNERIFAVRMMGARGYVVTFRRTDPLYTLDLTRPEAPRLVGALHVDGFSNYLHPLDDTHLLAIGQDADPRGRVLGFHLQIFDVADPSQPRRVHHEKLDAGSTSGAQGDHHAFMFEPSTQTLAVPWKGANYWGLVAYHVDAKAGFTRLGRVNHAVMYNKWFTSTCQRVDRAECGKKGFWWRFFSRPDLEVDRIVAIDGHLYSLSPSGLMVHRADRRLSRVRASLVSVPDWPARDPAAPDVVAAYRHQ